MEFEVGERPGQGSYVCTVCESFEVSLDGPGDVLPACPSCGRDGVSYVATSAMP